MIAGPDGSYSISAGRRKTGLDDALDQISGIEKAQERSRKNPAGGKIIEDTTKSKRRMKNELNKIKSQKDLDD